MIFFDLGGVVCRFLPQQRLDALGTACDLSADQVKDVLYTSGLIERWDLGRDSAAAIHRTVADRLGYPGSLAELQELWCRAFEPDLQVLHLIDGLRPLRTALLSDNDPLLLAALPQVFPEVGSRFDSLLFSCRFGATKPDPRVFTRALDAMGCAPAEALFVDDKAANVAAARRLGIASLRFSDAAGLSAALDGLRRGPATAETG
ncbi:HAD family phosphatase [Kitasatospora sp. NPDC002227]|uniref:HAD family hydrolase n=1 Tax=Kitasatospora sp. NPDC002227 TaxID=3154773 RepID=UPI00332220CF